MKLTSTFARGFLACLSVGSVSLAATSFEILVSNGDRIARIDPETLAYQHLTQSGPAFPVGLALGKDGSLLAGSAWTNDIHRFNPATGQYLGVFAQNAQLPILMKTGPDQDLYVASRDANGVLVYDGDSGALVRSFLPQNNSLMWWAFDVDFLPDGDLLVSSFERGSILRFDATTTQLEGVFSSAPLQYAAGIAWGPDANLYVARYATDRIDRIDGATGQPLGTFATGNGMLRPVDLAFTPDGRLFVVNERSTAISIFDATTGAPLGQVAVPGPALTGHSAIFILPEPTSLFAFAAIGLRRRGRAC